ncbi:MAG: VWA domain-containing protein [Candidatus Bathyarchaeia archaeon]|nr:VWA domain-containing protein [Candidatus Bathyarchaeota archaeon]
MGMTSLFEKLICSTLILLLLNSSILLFGLYLVHARNSYSEVTQIYSARRLEDKIFQNAEHRREAYLNLGRLFSDDYWSEQEYGLLNEMAKNGKKAIEDLVKDQILWWWLPEPAAAVKDIGDILTSVIESFGLLVRSEIISGMSLAIISHRYGHKIEVVSEKLLKMADYAQREIDVTRKILEGLAVRQDLDNVLNEELKILTKTYYDQGEIFPPLPALIDEFKELAKGKVISSSAKDFVENLCTAVKKFVETDAEYVRYVRELLTHPSINIDLISVIDCSGSMAWYSNIIYQSSNVLTDEWTKIAEFSIYSSIKTFDVVLETRSSDREQYLRIKSPSGKWYGYEYSFSYYPLDYTHDTYVKYIGADYIAIYQSSNVEQGIWEVYARGMKGRSYYLTVAIPPTKIDEVKEAAKYLLDLMSCGDQFSLVSFADDAKVSRALTLLNTKENKDSIKSAINSLVVGGGTAIGDGIYTAVQELKSGRHRENANPIIVLFTDGVWNTGSDPLQKAEEAKDAGVSIYTIGFGGVNHELLMEIASITGGKYFYSPNIAELKYLYSTIIEATKGEATITFMEGTIKQNEIIKESSIIDSSVTQATFSVSWIGSDLDLTLIRPDGILIDPNVAAFDPNIEYIEGKTYEIYKVNNPMPGNWTTIITGIYVHDSADFIMKVTAKSDVTIKIQTDKDIYIFPEIVKIRAIPQDLGSPILGANTSAIITRPDGTTVNIILHDDGLIGHGDDKAENGIYTNFFTKYKGDGIYTIRIKVLGFNLLGEKFVREDQKTILISGVPSNAMIVTFSFSGLSNDVSEPILMVDGINYYYSDFPIHLVWNIGSSHNYSWSDILSVNSNKRYVWVSANGLLTDKSGLITVLECWDNNVVAEYKTQFYLRVISDYGYPKGEGWYDKGAVAVVSINSPQGFLVQHVFTEWSGDVTATTPKITITMDGPKTLIANWRTDYTQLYIVLLLGMMMVFVTIITLYRMRRKTLYREEHKEGEKSKPIWLQNHHFPPSTDKQGEESRDQERRENVEWL